MANKDEGSKSGQKQPEGQRKFSQQQYDMLKRCCDKKDMTEWNKWRKEHPDENILLEGADLSECYLRGVLLNTGIYRDSLTQYSGEVHIECASFRDAQLQGADFSYARLDNSEFGRSHLEGVKLFEAHLEYTLFLESHLERAQLFKAHLEDADFSTAIVDGGTLIWDCGINRDTDFRGVGLDSARIEPGTKQLLEYNIRRMNWEVWYKEHFLLQWPVKLFWSFSDYGISTRRIIGWFFGLAVTFALVYWLWPSCVMFESVVGDIRGFWHALYFSVVTMTTLGFGDIAANPDSWWGQTLLMLQVILGYVLLGALITRFAVLFTAGGPAGKFSPTKTKETGDDKKHKALG